MGNREIPGKKIKLFSGGSREFPLYYVILRKEAFVKGESG
jgi:hypothetical protein